LQLDQHGPDVLAEPSPGEGVAITRRGDRFPLATKDDRLRLVIRVDAGAHQLLVLGRFEAVDLSC